MVSSALVSLPITPAKKDHLEQVEFVQIPAKQVFMFTSFSETLDKTSMSGHSTCWERSSTCQKKRENTDEVRIETTAIQLPLGSRHCPHLLQPPKKVHDETHFFLVGPEKY